MASRAVPDQDGGCGGGRSADDVPERAAQEAKVLTSVEMGMKNHELVPAQLVESIAGQSKAGWRRLPQRREGMWYFQMQGTFVFAKPRFCNIFSISALLPPSPN